MSIWYSIKEQEDVELSDNGETIEILFNGDHNGNHYVDVPVEFIEKVLPRPSQWISVEDRLPEKQAGYPVLHSKRGQTFAVWDMERTSGSWELIDYPHYVTHWFDLPEPPEEIKG